MTKLLSDTLIDNAEENTPKNYTLDGFMFYNESLDIAQKVSLDNLTAFLDSCYEYGDVLELYISPVYMPVVNTEPELPFELQEGYISGLDVGLEPMTVDGPFDSFGDLFDILNWGEDNTPEGYLLDTFMFYTDYMYKEMYIVDAFDFLDEHYADGADTVFNVTPVYMPDPDYEWPEEEEPVEENTPAGDEGEGSTPDEGGDAPSDGEESGTTETPDGGESGVETPTDTPEDTPSETPTETPDGEGESGEGGDSTDGSDSTDTPTVPDASEPETPVETPADSGSSEGGSSSDSGSSSSDSGSDSAPADGGSSPSDSGSEPAALFNLSSLFAPFKRLFTLLFGGSPTIV